MNTRFLSRAALLPLLACSALLGGCKQTDPGSATIKYRIGNDKTCEEAGVTDIHVILDQEEGIEDDGPCGNGEFEFTGIPVGSYSVMVLGINSEGIAIVDNLDDAETKLKIEGDGKELETTTIVMGDAPAELYVRWDFDFTDCAGAGIDKFLVEAFDQDGSNILVSDELDCEGASGYTLVADPDRELAAALVLNSGTGTPFGDARIIRITDASIRCADSR